MAKKKRSDKPSSIKKFLPSLITHNPDINVLMTPDPVPGDRMVRYRRNPACPECGAHPVVCMMRKRDAAYYRCRQCGHRWDVEV